MPNILVAAFAFAACICAQTEIGPRCEAVPEVRRAIDAIRFDRTHKMPDRLEWNRAQLDRLLAKYPREVLVHRWRFQFLREQMPDRIEPIRQSYLKRSEIDPNDAVATYLAALSLEGIDPPKTLQLLESSKQRHPAFSWNYYSLVWLYADGKFRDDAKASENVEGYFKTCPGSIDPSISRYLQRFGRPETVAAVAAMRRERLQHESDPALLKYFEDVWALEFQALPVREHPRLRQQIRADVNALQAANPAPDADFLRFLARGMRQAGASQDEVRVVEERILREFPQSPAAYGILSRRWNGEHPKPDANGTAAAWDAYTRAHANAVQEWMKQFPSMTDLAEDLASDLANLPNPDKDRITTLSESALKQSEEMYGASPENRERIARRYLDLHIRPARAVALLETSRELSSKARALADRADTVPDEERRQSAARRAGADLDWVSAMAKAYRRTDRGSRARTLMEIIASVSPVEPEMRSKRFAALGEVAAAQGRYTDALAWFRAALESPGRKAPDIVRGRIHDPLLVSAHEIWTVSGGSEETWRLWTQSPKKKLVEASDIKWSRQERPLPAFELTDIGGKTWRFEELRGKTLFMTVWATWCGPCRDELARFQKLYQATVSRSDLVMFSFNVDDEVGLVAPFMQQRGYTFPALLGNRYVSTALHIEEIPQSLIVDGNGVWRWQGLGYDPNEADWETAILRKIESVR